MRLAIYSLWRREITRFLRDRSRVFSSLGQPIVFWFLFAMALGNSSFSAGGFDLSEMSYGEYFFVGTLAMIVLFTSVFTTITVIEDRMQGFLQGVLVAPVPRSAIVIGKIAGGATLAVLQALVFLCLAPLAGVPMSLGGALQAAGALVLLAFALTGVGFSIAWMMDSTAGYHGIMMLFLLPMWLLSGSLFPVQGAHPALAAVMYVNPMTYGVAALRYGLYGTDAAAVQGLPEPVVAWGVTAAFGVVTVVLGALVVRRRSARGREVAVYQYLPTVNAVLNSIATVLICAGLVAIKRRNERLHVRLMLSAVAVSALFLVSYLVYHFEVGSVKFEKQGLVRRIYFPILISHVVLAAVQVPLIVTTVWLGLKDKRGKHRRLARITAPIWLYVSVTGVVVYVMLYRL